MSFVTVRSALARRQTVKRCLTALKDESGVAGLVIALVIMIISSSALAVFFSSHSSKNRELRRMGESASAGRLAFAALQASAVQATDQVLPCPADPTDTVNFGQATAPDGTGACTTNRGILPFVDLAMSEDEARDGHGRFFTYVVSAAEPSICDGDNARTGTLTDQDGGNFLFALISHGKNGAGAFSGPNQPVQGETPSAGELDNCGATGQHAQCTPTAAETFRTMAGAGDDDFDDQVFVSDSSKFTPDCEELNADPNEPPNAQIALNSYAAQDVDVFDTSNDSTANNTDNAQVVVSDDEVAILFSADNNVPTASCFWYKGDLPLAGNVVRSYGEYYFQTDSGNTLGNGLMLAMMASRDETGVEEPLANNPTCGGTDQYMGFADDPVFTARVLPTDTRRFGIEMDTESHYNPAPTPPTEENHDSTNNHVAIVARNVNHSGDTAGTDGPVCRDDVPGTNLGSDPFDGDAPTAGSQGCRVGPTATWLENGEPSVNAGTDNQYAQIRTEYHWYTGSGCGGSEFRVDFWVFPAGAHCTDDCDELNSNYTGRTPDASFCLPQQPGLEYVRFGFTTGFPAANSGTAGRSRIERFGITSERVGDIPGGGKVYAGDNERSAQVTDADVDTALNPSADVTSFSSIRLEDAPFDEYPVTVFSRNARFDINNNQGLGGVGIGGNNGYIDNVNSLPFESADESEKIVFEFDDLFRRFTVNLRNFGETNDADFTGQEIVRLRAYNMYELVGTADITACDFNDGNGDGHSMTITRDFGGNFDRVEVIPIPADTEDADAFTRFRVRGAKACGLGEMCGFDLTGTTVVLSRCHDVTLLTSSTGTGVSTEITASAVATELGNAGSNFDSNRSWLDLPNLNANLFSERGELRVQSGGGLAGGLGVEGSSTDVGGNLLDNGDQEQIRIVFDESWQKLNLILSRFGGDNNAPASFENATATFYLNGSQVATESLQACSVATSNVTSTGFEIDALPSFDEVRISAANAVDGGTSQFLVHAARGCDALADFSGTCTTSSTPTCTVSIP